MEIGEILAKLRTEQGIYQKEVASYLKVSVGTISNYEKGVHYPDVYTLSRLADYYGVTTDYLLGRTGLKQSSSVLDQHLTKDFTISDLVNITLELPQNDVSHLIDYVRLLKLRHDTLSQ